MTHPAILSFFISFNLFSDLHLCHCLLKVSDDVLYVLDADTETYQVRSHTCLTQLLLAHQDY